MAVEKKKAYCQFVLSLLASFFLGTFILSRPELFMVKWIQRYLCDNDYAISMLRRTPRKMPTPIQKQAIQRGLLYIGVMSTKTNLHSRVAALLDAWGQHPHIRLEIFANIKNLSAKSGVLTVLPNGGRIVTLPGVQDVAYPPQQKSFAMLKYIHDNHLNRFDWFMRADDDAYVKIEEVMRFLSKLDSGQPIFIGQPGYGKHQEDDLFGNNYCMGGPGIFMSRDLLRKVGPQLSTCIRRLYTEHEDIELGRCVRTVTNVSCTTAWEATSLFYQYYGKGQRDNIEGIPEHKRVNALTFHSNKDPKYQYSFHLSILSDRIKSLLLRISKLETDTKAMSQRILMRKSDRKDSESHLWNDITLKHMFSATGEVSKVPLELTKALSDAALYGVSSELRRRDGILPTQIDHVVVKNARHRVTALSEDTICDVEVWMNTQKMKYLNNIHLRRSFPKSMVFLSEPYDLSSHVNRNLYLQTANETI